MQDQNNTNTGGDAQASDGAAAVKVSRRMAQYAKGKDRKSRGLTLAQAIKALQDRPEFEDFAGDLERAIRSVRKQGNRTAASDRDAVFEALTEADRMGVALTTDDAASDTGFTKKETRAILDELVMLDLVEMYERESNRRGPKVMVFKLRHTRFDERFESVRRIPETAQVHTRRAA